MGFEIVTRVDRDRGTVHQASFVCDRCGKRITDLRNGWIDYYTWEPLPKNQEQRRAEIERRRTEQRVWTYCSGCEGTRPRDMCDWHLDAMVWDLLPAADRRKAKNLSIAQKAPWV